MGRTRVNFVVILTHEDGDEDTDYMTKCSNIEAAIESLDGVESVEAEIGEELE